MDVTIWIERSLGLSINKHMPSGSTIHDLKAALLNDDLFGSLSAKDLVLVVPESASDALEDGAHITGALSELEIRPPAESEQADEPECPLDLASTEAALVLSVLPKTLGAELKWYVWNTMWHATNLHIASHGEITASQERREKAAGDRERLERHFEAARSMGPLSVGTLHHLREQAERAGRAAAESYLDGSPLRPGGVEAMPPPGELEADLWSQIVGSIGIAAVASNEMNLSDLFRDKPELQYMHWMKGAEAQRGFESRWHALYDSPPTPPPEMLVNENTGQTVPGSEKEREREMGSHDAARKQAEIEKKALEMKDNVKRTANGAQKLLGTPLAYRVVRDCPVYSEPMPQAKKTSTVKSGVKVWGYPGSAAWIKIDARESNLPKEAMLVPQAWIPVRDHEDSERELVLNALWHELRAEKTLPDAIEVAWSGVDQPVEPNVAEYTIEARAKHDNLGKVHTVVSGTTKTRAAVRGLLPATDVQVRVKMRIVGPYTVDFRLAGPWRDFRTADESALPDSPPVGEESADASPPCPQPADVEGEGIYEVLHTFVTLRGEPSTSGTILGTLKKGACVFGVPFQVGKEPWIKLSAQTIPAAVAHMPPRDIAAGDSVFVLIDATPVPSLKLGVLLKRVGDSGSSDDKKKLGEWKVLHDKVIVREKASMDAPQMGFHKKGSKVLGVCLPIAGVDWLRVQTPYLRGVQSPDAWMLIDGQSIGLGRLLERLGDAPPEANPKKVKTLPKSSTRPLPPRPLTVPWVAAHGGLPSTPSTVGEAPLDSDLDVGMASECSLLHVHPADGGARLSFVAKRGPQWGDMNSCGREYRFYTEIATRGRKPGTTQPSMLGGEMRVPHCFCANWGKEGKEREGFILILELLDDPDWIPVDPELGCTKEQALAAVETLGRMHRVFSHSTLSGHEFDWLPSTVFDVRNAAHIQGYFTSILGSAQPLVQMLPPGAQATVERMAEGGLGECFERLAQPPLCLNHGDYRPENLRFSAPGRPPAVAVFDWGLVNVARGIADFAYFVMLSQTPEERRKREKELLMRYLDARGDSAKSLDEAWEDLKSASIAILGMILMTRHGVKTGGFKQGTRIMLSRMMRWVGEAITDWGSIEVVSSSMYY